MHARYISSMAVAVAGAFVVVASQAFLIGTAAWIAFGIGIVVMALALVPVLAGERHLRILGLDTAMLLLGAWTVVASLVYTGNTLQWLTLGEGAGLAALAVLSLTVNEIRLARSASKVIEPTLGEVARPARFAA